MPATFSTASHKSNNKTQDGNFLFITHISHLFGPWYREKQQQQQQVNQITIQRECVNRKVVEEEAAFAFYFILFHVSPCI